MKRTILHSDCNCFYASVEMLHHPELAGRPVAVAGDPEARHGIILTATYPAKRRGVKTGMAIWQARQVCPDLVCLPARMDLYLRFSRLTREIYGEYTDRVESFGCDEAWLDVTGSADLCGDGRKIAEELRKRIRYELGITVSVGVSWNKIFAKLGSDYRKPDAVTEFREENYQELVWPQPVRNLLCVGHATEEKLRRLGITTIGDLACAPTATLKSYLGKMGIILHAFANGWDDTPVAEEDFHAPIRSVGNSTTAPRDLTTPEDVKIILMALSESVSSRLRKNGLKGCTVELEIRDDRLISITRQKKLSRPTQLTDDIFHGAYELFLAGDHLGRPVRSLGVRAADLVPETIPTEQSLFESEEQREKRERMDRAVDEIRRRYGYFSIQRAMMLEDRALSSLDAEGGHTVHPVGYFHP